MAYTGDTVKLESSDISIVKDLELILLLIRRFEGTEEKDWIDASQLRFYINTTIKKLETYKQERVDKY